MLAKPVGRLVIAGELGRRLRAGRPRRAARRARRGSRRAPDGRRLTGNVEAAALVGSIEVLAAATLRDLVDHLAGRATLPRHTRRLAAGRRA